MTARGRLLSGLVTMVIAMAGFVTVGTLPAAAKPGIIPYVALGDSYAAGTAIDGSCPRTSIGYPTLLDLEESRIVLLPEDNVPCSGATISDVADQLSALDPATRLVTLTVGGADLDVSRVLDACTAEVPSDCPGEIGRVFALLGDCPGGVSSLDSNLTKLYAAVADKAPRARIVVTGYPLLFEPPLPPTDPRAAINRATTLLNCVIERAVAATEATDVNIHYVDVTTEFAGHGIGCGCTDPFIHNLPDPEAFHPNAAGYRAYADAIKAELPGGWLDKQNQLV
jgi:lysophospholipase L1-like esterase